jgi:hypothetical protein
MQDLARGAARGPLRAVWPELDAERQAQVVALLVRLALQWVRQETAPATGSGGEEGSDARGEPFDQDPQ